MESTRRPADADSGLLPPDELGESHVEAEFALESRALCPHCQMAIDTIQVIRLLRSRVNFTSSLPRRGHVMVCPSCHSILNGALGGIL
ncbi:MAG: hypothetical protein R3325_07165 [Thermoanaerobaculia bacterium]|nr:hypothetical protein [Thermoanaerobaculia bacterium]